MLLAQQAQNVMEQAFGIETLKSLLNLGTAGLLLIGLLVVARVFGVLWLQMREVEQKSLNESREFVRQSIEAGKQLGETLRLTIVDATRLAEMMRTHSTKKE